MSEGDVETLTSKNSVMFNDMNETFGNRSNVPPKNVMPMGFIPEEIVFLKTYIIPVTVAVGIVGNSFIFYIFTRTKLKKPSSSRYLAAASIADTGFLCTTLVTNLATYHEVKLYLTVGPCQLTIFGNFVFTFLSTWYLTAVIIEKYIGVTWPRKKSRVCTVFRAKCVIIGLAIMGLVCYLYITYFFGVYEPFPGLKACAIWPIRAIREAYQILSRMDAIVNFAIPYIIIFILSCLIANRTWQYHKLSRSAGERFLRRQRVTTPGDKEFKTTPLLLLLALCTLLLCTPNNTSSVRRVFEKERFMPTQLEVQVFDVFHYLFILNNSIKCFVYMASSHAFLKEMGFLCCCLRSVIRRYKRNSSSNELAGLGQEESSNKTKNVATSTEGIV